MALSWGSEFTHTHTQTHRGCNQLMTYIFIIQRSPMCPLHIAVDPRPVPRRQVETFCNGRFEFFLFLN